MLFDLDGGVGNDIGVSKEVKHLVVLLVLPWCRGVTWSIDQSRQKQARDHQGKNLKQNIFRFFSIFGGMVGL